MKDGEHTATALARAARASSACSLPGPCVDVDVGLEVCVAPSVPPPSVCLASCLVPAWDCWFPMLVACSLEGIAAVLDCECACAGAEERVRPGCEKGLLFAGLVGAESDVLSDEELQRLPICW